MPYRFVTTLLLTACWTAQCTAASTLLLELPEGMSVKAATATAAQLKLSTDGVISGRTITFKDLLPDTAYDIKLTLADGTVLQGVDMGWYTPEPAKADAQPLDDDDRKQIKELFDGVQAFENKRNMLVISGDHDRVTILAELIADYAFYGRKGDEVIWRVELWYFKNQHGGWEKVAQQSRILRRVRFKTAAEYKRETASLRWVPQLGGIRVGKDESKAIRLPAVK